MIVPGGSSVGIVGTSGAGKSTLVDIMLGVLQPDLGSVSIDGQYPWIVAAEHPGSIAYVPQKVALVNGSIRDNVALGLKSSAEVDELVVSALEQACLYSLLFEDREGLDTVVGEGGVELSGGQRQRLGLARALFSRPKVLVLDEATSALDTETEHAISQALAELNGITTRVVVAHRLSTVRTCDSLVYLEAGRVRAIGTFDDVRALSTDFDRQARLSGM